MDIADLATVDFAADPTGQAYGDWVIRRAPLLFKSGEYPDKQFSMTPEELQAAVNDFRKPAEFKIEHKDSVLDGKLGMLVRAEYHREKDQQQATMSGKCMIPRWLHDLFPDKPLPLSVSWDRKTKRVSHVGFVTSPRVAGAAALPELEAAFANFSKAGNESVNGGKTFDGYRTEHGMKALQSIHDISASHGSLCKMPAEVENRDAGENIASSKKTDGVGKPEDQKRTYFSLDDPEDFSALAQAMFMHGSEKDALQIIHDAASKVGAKCSYEYAHGPKDNIMPLKTGTTSETTSTDSSGQKGYQFNSDDPAIKELQEQLAKQKEITENQRKKAVAAEAASFASDEITAHRAFPNEKQSLIDMYTMAADADNTIGGTVDFSGGKTTRVSALLASHKARVPHPLAKEGIPAGQDLQVLLSQRTQPDPTKAEMSADRRAELMAATPLGQQVLRLEQETATNGKH